MGYVRIDELGKRGPYEVCMGIAAWLTATNPFGVISLFRYPTPASRRDFCACPAPFGDLRTASRPSAPPNHQAYRMGLRLVVGRGGGAGGGAPKALAFEQAQKTRGWGRI